VSTRIVALLLSLAALVFTPRAFATSCEVPQLKSSSERAEVIFLGVAAAETPVGGGVSNFRLRVERVFKGSLPATVTVSGGGMKGSSFTVGDRYLVFARVPNPPRRGRRICSRTSAAGRKPPRARPTGSRRSVSAQRPPTPALRSSPARQPTFLPFRQPRR